MIRIEKINKYFNRHRKNEIHVINNTTLTLEDKGLVALLGPSGCGKTTLLNAIGGLDNVRSGKIYIDGKKITTRFAYFRDKIRNLNIGYIFQDYKLVENLSVYDNVALVLKMLGIKDKKEIEVRVKYVLESVGMWRYRHRPANMLSGGERQRVGIARAIVKNPNIIIADEPTGNLDSKNSIEIMNIIKAISKERLVILVTHEVNLAKFYATRIIEISDGTVTNDYINEHNDELDYAFDNCFYLKDFATHQTISNELSNINVYSDTNESLKLNIIIKNNNIYIQNINNEKIEVVDEESNIEIIDDHYKKIDKSLFDKYKYDYLDVCNKNIKPKYSSIFNPITFITNGFKQVLNYTFMKKVLLFGFFLSGMFVMFGISRIAANLTVHDRDFVNTNKNYLVIESKKINLNNYLNYKNDETINYILPGDSKINLLFKNNSIYQSSDRLLNFQGSISSINMINKNNIVSGRMPENSKEVVVDKMVIDEFLMNNQVKMLGISRDQILGSNLKVLLTGEFKIVGIVDMESPSIYFDESEFINVLYNRADYMYGDSIFNDLSASKIVQDYTLFNDLVYLKEGAYPNNDYEVMVNIAYKDEWKLNKEMSEEINGRKLKVVGYYDSSYPIDKYLVNSNMILYSLVDSSSNMVVYPKDKGTTLQKFRDTYQVNIIDSYDRDRKEYMESRKNETNIAIISSGIIIGISLIEILLMLRASFLSRVKEVGIYRAIGVKKRDIYIMFSGEIIAITTIANLPGVLLSYYIFKTLGEVEFFNTQFLVNPMLFLIAILSILIFNLIVGLIPVFLTIRKTPAQILARTDV